MAKKIAIIGGGYTGLTAAYRLSQKGHQVFIFERGSDLGGLAGGFQIGGTSIEKAYHHLFKTDTDILDLVKELGIEDKLEWHDSSISIYYDKNLHAFNGALDLIKFKPLAFHNRIRAGLVVLFLQKYKNWKKFEEVSAYKWMKKWSGKQVTEVIWEPLLKGKFDQFYDKVSMAWLWARLHIRANSRDGLEKEKLGYFNGGFDVITKALIKKLKEKDVQIFTNCDIEKITRKDGKLYIEQNRDIEIHTKLEFDNILATVPSHVFAKLAGNSLDSDYMDKLQKIPYLGAICAIFTTDQEISPYYWHNINDVSFPFLVFIHHTKLIPKERYGGKYVYYIGSYIPHDHKYFQMADEEVYDLWFKHLKMIFPDFDLKQIDEKFLWRFRYAQHIVGLDYSSKIPDYKTPIEGVYLSNFSQIYPEDRGTNFAVREGNKIAELLDK
jgi:protoporphyrinogen oxidase